MAQFVADLHKQMVKVRVLWPRNLQRNIFFVCALPSTQHWNRSVAVLHTINCTLSSSSDSSWFSVEKETRELLKIAFIRRSQCFFPHYLAPSGVM